MTYELVFKQDAHKEWNKLDPTIRVQFKKKLIERLENPRVESSRLNGMKDCYKIKLRKAGYRLVYQVRDLEILISIVAVGKRERNAAYKIAAKRI
ncbi:MAG: type II toxin-antitoxin system RelE/ParE family toxin [Alteromonadaceae bacterium]|nr:type II toxin-antitoxin system RelE/ParE family toxin [Alteromonadaceae bacterium]